MLYGPYNCSDRRKRVVDNGTTKLYARYLIEVKIGRELTDKEQVHHIDGDPTNDDTSNLEVLLTSNHIKDHRQEYFEVEVTCMECKKNFMLTPLQHRNRESNIRRGKSERGPFCSRSCSGKYSQRNFFHI